MKKNFNCFTLAIVALLIVGFASCSNDDEPAVDNPAETISVFLKISNVPSTRAEGATQAGDPVLFESGHLYFTNTGGDILRYHSIGAEADIKTTELTDGHLVENLATTVTNVYIVGNYTAEGTSAIPKAGNISAVKAHVLKVEDQIQVNDENIVNLYGESGLTPPVDPATYSTATVHLAPTVARMELTDMTASGRITSFKVSGIYIDRFYTEAQVDGTVDDENLTASSTADTDYAETSTKYTTALQGAVYDSGEWADASLIAKPTSGVWGYNLFAGKYNVTTPDESVGVATPHIVIRFSEIGTAEGDISFDAPQFITIKNSTITEIKPGHVYTIKTGALVFDETNLTAGPNMETMDVEVTVTLATWIPVEFIPKL